MPLYAFLAAFGSVTGCVLLYFLARKGGEAVFHRKVGSRAEMIRHSVEKNGFGGMLFAALLPPPTPFKFFVLAAGGFEVSLFGFSSANNFARLIPDFGIGFFSVRDGRGAMPFILHSKMGIAVSLALFVVLSYLASRVIVRDVEKEQAVK